MRIELDFIELHSQLFLEGTNWGPKIDKDLKRGTKRPQDFYYDSEKDVIVIIHNNKASVVKTWAYMNPTNPKDFGVELAAAPAEATPVVRPTGGPLAVKQVMATAQVFDPTKAPPETIRRRAKFQGEESQGE